MGTFTTPVRRPPRLLKGFAILVIVGLLTVAIQAILAYLQSTAFFRVIGIEWSGLVHHSVPEMTERFQSEIGKNLFQTDLSDIRTRILSDPWIKEVVIRRVLPDRLWITVVERTPAAVEIGPLGKTLLRSEDGRVLDRGGLYDPALVRIVHFNVDTYDQALILARVVDRPGMVINLSKMDDLVVEMAGHRLHFGLEDYAARWQRFLRIEPDLERRGYFESEIDLRFTKQVVVRQNGNIQ